jgi:5-methylcytosine-specific restriction endonuclease McrA
MGRHSGEQARRRFVSKLPALLTPKCVRRCVETALLPANIYRPSGPTPEFSSNYFKSRDDEKLYLKRQADWHARGKPPSPAKPEQPRLAYRREKVEAKTDVLMRLQRGYCYLCSQPFRASRPPTLEHVKPRALGGKTHRNVLLAHADCNGGKADRPPRPCELLYLTAINLRRYSAEAA